MKATRSLLATLLTAFPPDAPQILPCQGTLQSQADALLKVLGVGAAEARGTTGGASASLDAYLQRDAPKAAAKATSPPKASPPPPRATPAPSSAAATSSASAAAAPASKASSISKARLARQAERQARRQAGQPSPAGSGAAGGGTANGTSNGTAKATADGTADGAADGTADGSSSPVAAGAAPKIERLGTAAASVMADMWVANACGPGTSFVAAVSPAAEALPEAPSLPRASLERFTPAWFDWVMGEQQPAEVAPAAGS